MDVGLAGGDQHGAEWEARRVRAALAKGYGHTGHNPPWSAATWADGAGPNVDQVHLCNAGAEVRRVGCWVAVVRWCIQVGSLVQVVTSAGIGENAGNQKACRILRVTWRPCLG